MQVLVNDPIADEAVELLEDAGHEVDTRKRDAGELPEAIGAFDALVVRSGTQVTAEVLAAAERLQVIARSGVGVDNIDLDAAAERGVTVTNAPGASSNAVAELTVAHMLALARNLQEADATLRGGEWAKKRLGGVELRGRTLALLGIGRIGGRVAELAQGFGMDVVAHDPYVEEARARELGVDLVGSREDAVARGDFVSVHVPLTEETRGLVDGALLERMGSGTFLVNCARGGVVDEDALYDALKQGTIAGAALDVYAEEPAVGNRLLELPNFRGTPHLGAATEEAQVRVGTTAAEDVVRVLSGKDPKHRVV